MIARMIKEKEEERRRRRFDRVENTRRNGSKMVP